MNNGVTLCYYHHLKEVHGNQNDVVFMQTYIHALKDRFDQKVWAELRQKVMTPWPEPTVGWLMLKLEELNEIHERT
jgi:hypothetical protein